MEKNQVVATEQTLPQIAETLLPHRPPMLLVETLVERQGSRAVAMAILPTTGPFVCGGYVIPEYFIELIAQTAALGNCFDARACGTATRNGMLVGVDSFSWPRQAPIGIPVSIATNITFVFGAVKVVSGEVHAGEELLAAGDIKVWEDLG